ncbi:MAG TPA: hypothetical protein PKW06_11625, partial [Cyclobacteriaceae bacterium]|nr:hypothetical protein [Cyclobacteriaceae bacterium]
MESNGYLNNTVVRYGIAERWEVSALADYRVESMKENGLKVDLNGLAAFDVGGRYHIYTGKGLVPSLGFQLRFRLPVLSANYEIDKVAPRFTLITSQQISDTFTFVTNWGGSWNGINSRHRFLYLEPLFPNFRQVGWVYRKLRVPHKWEFRFPV